MRFRLRAGLLVLAAGIFPFAFATPAWNPNAYRLIADKAVDTLPSDIRPFFEANRRYLVLHATDSVDAAEKKLAERHNHFIHLDHYGPFPFSGLPREYKAAAKKFGRHTLEANGLLPWEIGLYSAKLTDAFRNRNWSEAKLNAALLASYVADAHDPFNTTSNNDGQLTGQTGVHERFTASLVDRYSLFFFIHPNEAAFIPDPTDHAFEACLSSHTWIESVLLGDLRARQSLADYTDDYYDRFYNQAGAILVRQISDAATDVGSYWLTAWVNAGKPALPSQ